MSSSIHYSRLSNNGNEVQLKAGAKSLRLPWALFITSIFLTIVSTFLFLSSFAANPTDLQCATQLSPYSPALAAVDYEWQTYENEFAQESKYRGKPTSELEKAWEDLWQFGIVSMDAARIESLNKSAAEDWRQVDGSVGVFLEVFHQIHCLNLIRQYTYRDVYDYSSHPSFQGPDYLLRTHVDHCIETIRLNLMCVSDVTPVMIKHDPTHPKGESPDFNTLHKCRRFDKLQDWTRAHVVSNTFDDEHSGHHHG